MTEIVRIGREHLALLTELFEQIATDPDIKFFHPHPFTPSQATIRAAYTGPDVYFLILNEGRATGYGFLRGWEEGHEIPSLGIYVLRECRGSGDADSLMRYLHNQARHRGASQVRLKVHPDNIRAWRLYGRLGYRFSSVPDEEEYVGFFDL